MVAWAILDLDLIQQTKAKPDELRDVITQLEASPPAGPGERKGLA